MTDKIPTLQKLDIFEINNKTMKKGEYIQYNKVIYYLDQIEKTLDNKENNIGTTSMEQIKTKNIKMNDYLKHSIQSIKSIINNENNESSNQNKYVESPLLLCDDDLTDTLDDNNGYVSSSSSVSDSDGTLADSDSSLRKKNSTSSLSSKSSDNSIEDINENECSSSSTTQIFNESKDKILTNQFEEIDETLMSSYSMKENEKIDKVNLLQKIKSLQKEQDMIMDFIKDQVNFTISETLAFDNKAIMADNCLMEEIEKDSEYLKKCEENMKSFISETIKDYYILLAEKDIELEKKQKTIDDLNEKVNALILEKEETKNYSIKKSIDEYEILLNDIMEQMKIDDNNHSLEVAELEEEVYCANQLIGETQKEKNSFEQKLKQASSTIKTLEENLNNKEKEIQLFELKNNKLKSNLDESIKEIETLKLSMMKKEESYSKQYEKLKAQNEGFKNLAVEIKNNVNTNKEKYQETLDALNKIIKQKDDALLFSNNRINDYKSTIAKLNEEIQSLKTKLDSEHYQFKKEFSKLKNIIRDNEEQIENLEEKVRSTEKMYRKSKDKHEKKLKEISLSSAKEAEGLWYVIDTREKEIDNLNGTLSELEKEKENLKVENEAYAKQHDEDIAYIEKVRKANNEKIEELTNNSKKMEEDYQQESKVSQNKYRALDEEQTKLKQKLSDMTNSLQSLEERQDQLKRDNESLNQSIQTMELDYQTKKEKLCHENLQKEIILKNEIKKITENSKIMEEKYLLEIKKIDMEKNKKINVLVNANKELEEKYKLERQQKAAIAKCIRDKNHEEVVMSKKNKSNVQLGSSMKNIHDRMNLYQKIIVNSSVNNNNNKNKSKLTSINKINNIDDINNTLKSKSLLLLKIFQNA